MIISGASAAIFFLGAYTFSTSSVEAQFIRTDEMPAKIEALKDDVVARLSKCESAGAADPDGLIVFDTNHKASIGRMQFQTATVIQYYKKLYKQTITSKEANVIAMDKEKATQLAKDIIFNDGGIGNWYNCANKLGLPAEIKILNKLD
jgi:hypothetical protein